MTEIKLDDNGTTVVPERSGTNWRCTLAGPALVGELKCYAPQKS
jgi:hypothetical protein